MFSTFYNELEPKLITLFRRQGYSAKAFLADSLSGLSVAIVALPLAMAIAIASNLPPERGLYTAIVAGVVISLLGGSRYQIGGPTAAFIVTVALVGLKHGYEGLAIATLMAGFILIMMSLFRAGELIKFIPYPVITGFTSGIAVLIVFSQLRDFFGLEITSMPPDFIEKLWVYLTHLHQSNPYSIVVALGSIAILIVMRKYYPKIPGAIVVVVVSAFVVSFFDLPIDTIQSRFGSIPSTLPTPQFFFPTFDQFRTLLPDAITIATLAAIESLLSAVVADGMTGAKHKPNAELFAQGVANSASVIFGGIPATGAIARTATNIRSGATSPVSGIMHAIWLALFMLLFASLIIKVPLAALSAILIVVAWNMAEIKHFKSIFQATRQDRFVLLVTFGLTVLVDLNFAIQAGISLAAILFIDAMMKNTRIESSRKSEEEDADAIEHKSVPDGVEVYELDGPLFFGVAERFVGMINQFETPPKVLILRMRHVPMIDAAGLNALKTLQAKCAHIETTLILSGVRPEIRKSLRRAKVCDVIDETNIVDHIDKALERAKVIIN